MAIRIMLEVMIESFATEASAKGNHSARGVSCRVTHAKGCDASAINIIAPSFGNAGSLLFLTKDKALVAQLNKAKAAKPSAEAQLAKALAELEALKAQMAGKGKAKAAKPSAEEQLAKALAELEALKASE